jgi:hypothetical protein
LADAWATGSPWAGTVTIPLDTYGQMNGVFLLRFSRSSGRGLVTAGDENHKRVAHPPGFSRLDLAANEAYERWRATARDTLGCVLKGNSKPFMPQEMPNGVINLSDPDSRVIRTQCTRPRQATTRRPRSATANIVPAHTKTP